MQYMYMFYHIVEVKLKLTNVYKIGFLCCGYMYINISDENLINEYFVNDWNFDKSMRKIFHVYN